MNKLSEVTYQRLLAQANEAKELKLDSLTKNVLSSVGSVPRDVKEEFLYAYTELEENVNQLLWKAAMEIISYHDATSSDIQKMETVIKGLTKQALMTIESSLGVSNKIGPNEPKLPGQSR